jgi:hypothetical protein
MHAAARPILQPTKVAVIYRSAKGRRAGGRAGLISQRHISSAMHVCPLWAPPAALQLHTVCTRYPSALLLCRKLCSAVVRATAPLTSDVPMCPAQQSSSCSKEVNNTCTSQQTQAFPESSVGMTCPGRVSSSAQPCRQTLQDLHL